MASTAEPTEPKEVIMITDVTGLIFWVSRRTSNPSIFSILISVITMSKFSCLIRSMAISPLIGFLDRIALF